MNSDPVPNSDGLPLKSAGTLPASAGARQPEFNPPALILDLDLNSFAPGCLAQGLLNLIFFRPGYMGGANFVSSAMVLETLVL